MTPSPKVWSNLQLMVGKITLAGIEAVSFVCKMTKGIAAVTWYTIAPPTTTGDRVAAHISHNGEAPSKTERQ